MVASNIPDVAKVYRLPACKDQYTDATALRVLDEPVELPTKGQVLVKLHAASLNFRDLAISRKAFPGDYPADLIPLSDGAGEIIAIGEDVSRFSIGDRVVNTFFENWVEGPTKVEYHAKARGGTVHGVLAQYRLFPEAELVSIPEYLSFEEAATLPCTGVTAYNALFSRSPLTPNSSVLVLGTGGFSMTALQLAKAAGSRVYLTSSSDEKIKAAIEKFGADGGVNYRTTPHWAADLRKLTDGHGVDHVLEIGGAGTLLQSIQSASANGNVYLLGASLSALESQPAVTSVIAHAIFGLNLIIQIHGIYVGSREMQEDLITFMTEHNIHPVIDKVFDFDHVVDAFAYQSNGPYMGKVVISI
ncbi:hypothetical protein BS47DRAFT_1314540, partial [Hydnum rufescens UP504]